MICGFCSETEEEHQDTLDVIKKSNYSLSYMFYYSERPGTLAERKYEDDIPLEVKKRRLSEVIKVQADVAYKLNQKDIGQVYKVLIEGDSKRSDQHFKGRTSQYKVVVFPKMELYKKGDYASVKILEASNSTLKGELIE